MMWNRCGAVAALAMAWFGLMGAAVAGDVASCVLHRVVDLDVSPDRCGRPLVKVSLNGTMEYFLVDTAGIYSGVTPDTVSELGLEARYMKTGLVHMVSGETSNHIVRIEHMQIGTLALPPISLVVMPPSAVAADSQGLLSGEFLHLFDLEMDPVAAKFSLFLHNECSERVVHWTHGPYAALDFRMSQMDASNSWRIVRRAQEWHIVVPAKLDGEDIEVTIDTGASTSVMQYGEAEALLSSDQMHQLKRVDTDFGSISPVYRHPFKILDLGGVQIKNPSVGIVPGSRGTPAKILSPKPQLILGDNVLNQLHVYIAYQDHKIYITAADAK